MVSKALRNELRVLANSPPASIGEWSFHKQCEDGTHWNETSKKCMPLSDELQKSVSTAKEWSKKADTDSDSHSSARDFNREAATKLQAAGFGKLSKEHAKLGQKHHEKYKSSMGEQSRRSSRLR